MNVDCWSFFPIRPMHWIIELKLIEKFHSITNLIFGLSIPIPFILMAIRITHLLFSLPLILNAAAINNLFYFDNIK